MVRTDPALLSGVSQGGKQVFHTLLPRCDGAPDESFSLRSSLVLPSSPGAGRCHLTASSNPSHIGHPLFLTPRKKHVKVRSQTKTEARGATCTPPEPLSSAPAATRNYSCTGESGFRREWEGPGESVSGRCGAGSAPGKALKEQHGVRTSSPPSYKAPCKPPESLQKVPAEQLMSRFQRRNIPTAE